MRFIGTFLGYVCAVVLVGVLAVLQPSIVIDVMDYNLAAIKWASGLIPAPHGKRVESALRLLHFESMLILAEALLVCRLILGLIFMWGRVATMPRPDTRYNR